MALTIDRQHNFVIGDKYFEIAKITGDGSTTTFTAGVGLIDAVILINQDDTGTTHGLSWSGTTVTFGKAIANTKIVWLLTIGTA